MPIRSKSLNQYSKKDQEDKKPFKYKTLKIITPEDNSAMHSNDGVVAININLSPRLEKDHSIKLLIDGSDEGGLLKTTSLLLKDLDRGTHTLLAQVVDKNGELIQQSKTVTFTLHKISVLNKPSPAPSPK